MNVRSDRRHTFAVEPEVVWDALLRVERYPEWWPWLRDFDGEQIAAGDEWNCVVKPPLPYVVRFKVKIDFVAPVERVEATVDGDVQGSASVALSESSGGCIARMRSDLSPSNPLLRGVGLVAWPMVRFAHDWVLDTGARQFREGAL